MLMRNALKHILFALAAIHLMGCDKPSEQELEQTAYTRALAIMHACKAYYASADPDMPLLADLKRLDIAPKNLVSPFAPKGSKEPSHVLAPYLETFGDVLGAAEKVPAVSFLEAQFPSPSGYAPHIWYAKEGGWVVDAPTVRAP